MAGAQPRVAGAATGDLRGLRWPPGAGFTPIVAWMGATLAVYASTTASMVQIWVRSGTFAHGFLVIPISLWLLWQRRHALAAAVPRTSAAGFLLLVACVAAWVAAAALQVQVVRQLAVIGMVLAGVLACLGPAVLREATFPLAFLFFAVPTGEFLIPAMMDITAGGAVALLRASGVPVYRDGWLISTPPGVFQVADACSGVRYLIGATVSGALFAWLFFRVWRKRIIFMGFVWIFTVLMNVFRAYVIMLLAYLSDMRIAVGVDHFIYGWVLFGVLLAVVFGTGLRYADAGPTGAAGVAHARPAGPAALPGRFLRPAALGLLVMMAGPLFVQRWDAAAPDPGLPALDSPAALAGLAIEPGPRPAWLRPDAAWDERHGTLQRAGARVGVHLLRHRDGAPGSDVAWLRDFLSPVDAVLVADEDGGPDTPAGPTVRRMRIETPAGDRHLAYWFVVGGDVTANPITAKFLEARRQFRGKPVTPVLVAVSIATRGLERPDERLRAVVSDLMTPLTRCLADAASDATSCGRSGAVPATSSRATAGVEGRAR